MRSCQRSPDSSRGSVDAVSVDFRATGSADALPESVALCVYRVLQEALRNIARHAKAGQVKVRLATTAHKLTLSVNDSGIGFDMERLEGNGGLGLVGMSDRVAAVNGRLVVESAAGEGTTIKVEIPVGSHAAPLPRTTSRRAAARKPRRPRDK